MTKEEHWRHRLMELHAASKMTQAAFAAKISLDPSYLSRLFYPPGKAGRKNIGIEVMRAVEKTFQLPAGWFDFKVGAALPGAPGTLVNEPKAGQERSHTGDQILWPFQQVTYQRLMGVKQALGKQKGIDAMIEIDKYLDVLVTKLERDVAALKKQRA